LDYPWANASHTSVVLTPQGEWHWWTFAGGKANAGLAYALSEALGHRATWDNFAVRVQGGPRADEIEGAVRSLRGAAPEGIVAAVDERALEGLKFAECLPPGQAVAVVRTRLADPAVFSNVLGNLVRIVVGH
ncbi:MAG: ATP-dependent helicase, partial [Gemmataceae bacterium]|nr:ATP-dependent helicase [Gemmataceae bacterium]